jgi:deazaflavin-dependent oxidoreductase (nitroreductase family)
MTFRSGFLTVLKHTINPLAMRAARSGRGPFSLIRHVGRKSGATYETPLILAEVPQGFVAELTYGEDVAWYRNVTASRGRCTVLHRGETFEVDRMDPMETEAGLKAFGGPRSAVLRVLRRTEFRLLHVAGR